MKWTWPSVIAALAIVAILLAVADSLWLRDWVPFSLPRPRPASELSQVPPGRRFVGPMGPRPPLAPTQGLFSFWWFLSVGVAFLLSATAALVLFPARARTAVERLEAPGGLLTALAAGIASVLLLVGALFVLRATFFLLPLVPVLLALAALGTVFGLACLALALARRLRRRMGPAHPLLLASTGLLVFFDVALIPFAGWLALALAAAAALGLSVITRLGSSPGWSIEELN
jgi:hypothetical protein